MEKRYILWWLLLFLLLCNTLVTLNINIAIVSMVKKTEDELNLSNSILICPNTTFFLKNFDQDQKPAHHVQQTQYNWSDAEQNAVLSGYYWLNYVSILPGGILSHKYGSKLVVGYAQGISSLMSSLIPVFSDHGYLPVAWIRAIQGVLSFMSVPAGLYTILGNWSPPKERGKFAATLQAGSALGLFFGSIIFGYIAEYIHWKYVFHLTSVCGLLWTILWYLLAHDSPKQHPSISSEEKKYIEDSLSNSIGNIKDSIPWKGIMTSVPFLVCLLAMNSLIWLFVVLATYTPIYLKTMFGLNSNEIGILTSFPQLIAGLLALGLGFVNDFLLQKKLISMTNLRKLGSILGSFVAVFPLLIIPFVNCDINVVIWGITWCSIVKGIGVFGPPLVIVDLSPKFCGILEGFSGTFTSVVTFIFSAIITYLSSIWDMDTVWKFTFIATSFYIMLTNLIFICLGTTEVQPWNFKVEEEKKSTKNYKELEPIIVSN